jgi:uncharacterized RDD family membrane protein YckC
MTDGMQPSTRCPSCEKVVEVRDHDAGRTLRCPECDARYTVLGSEGLDPSSEEVPVLPYREPLPGPHRWRDPLPGRLREVRPWVRLWARIVDWMIWREILWPSMKVSGLLPDTESWTRESWLLLGLGFSCVALLLWVPVEALLLSTWGKTPGKWLLRVDLTGEDGEALSSEQALRRSMHVFVRGMACGLVLLEWVARLLAGFELRRTGKTRWDSAGGHCITHYRVGWTRTLVAVVIVIGPDLVRALLRIS